MDGYMCVTVLELGQDALIRHLLVEEAWSGGGFMVYGRDIGSFSCSLKDRALIFFDGQTKVSILFGAIKINNLEMF